MNNSKIKFDELSNRIIDAAIEVHKILGPGFLESIYHNAMKTELQLRFLKFDAEKEIKIEYKLEGIGIHRADLIVENEIIVELKAVSEINDVHEAQIISYLKASGLRIGLIINFAKKRIDVKRKVFGYENI